MKWKKSKLDGTRQSQCGVFSCIVFQYEGAGWEGAIFAAGDNEIKLFKRKNPETCMKLCEDWLEDHIHVMQKELKKNG